MTFTAGSDSKIPWGTSAKKMIRTRKSEKWGRRENTGARISGKLKKKGEERKHTNEEDGDHDQYHTRKLEELLPFKFLLTRGQPFIVHVEVVDAHDEENTVEAKAEVVHCELGSGPGVVVCSI